MPTAPDFVDTGARPDTGEKTGARPAVPDALTKSPLQDLTAKAEAGFGARNYPAAIDTIADAGAPQSADGRAGEHGTTPGDQPPREGSDEIGGEVVMSEPLVAPDMGQRPDDSQGAESQAPGLSDQERSTLQNLEWRLSMNLPVDRAQLADLRVRENQGSEQDAVGPENPNFYGQATAVEALHALNANSAEDQQIGEQSENAADRAGEDATVPGGAPEGSMATRPFPELRPKGSDDAAQRDFHPETAQLNVEGTVDTATGPDSEGTPREGEEVTEVIDRAGERATVPLDREGKAGTQDRGRNRQPAARETGPVYQLTPKEVNYLQGLEPFALQSVIDGPDSRAAAAAKAILQEKTTQALDARAGERDTIPVSRPGERNTISESVTTPLPEGRAGEKPTTPEPHDASDLPTRMPGIDRILSIDESHTVRELRGLDEDTLQDEANGKGTRAELARAVLREQAEAARPEPGSPEALDEKAKAFGDELLDKAAKGEPISDAELAKLDELRIDAFMAGEGSLETRRREAMRAVIEGKTESYDKNKNSGLEAERQKIFTLCAELKMIPKSLKELRGRLRKAQREADSLHGAEPNTPQFDQELDAQGKVIQLQKQVSSMGTKGRRIHAQIRSILGRIRRQSGTSRHPLTEYVGDRMNELFVEVTSNVIDAAGKYMPRSFRTVQA